MRITERSAKDALEHEEKQSGDDIAVAAGMSWKKRLHKSLLKKATSIVDDTVANISNSPFEVSES